MKRINTRSLRFRLLAYIASIFIVFLLLVMINNTITLREIESKIYQITKDNLTTYQNRLNDSFTMAENYLINFTFDNGDILIIDRHNLSSSQWFSSIYRVQKSFSSATSIYDMDGFFLYSLTGKTYISSARPSIPTKVSSKIKPAIKSYIESGEAFSDENKSQWLSLKIEENYYLIRIIKVNNSYLGAWVSTSNALKPFVGVELTNQIFFTDHKGNVLSSSAPIDKLLLTQPKDSGTYPTLEINKKKVLVVSCPLDSSSINLISLIPHKQFYVDINKFIPLLLITVIVVIILMIVALLFINNLVIHPLVNLNHGIISLKRGDLDTQIKISSTSTEFTQVNNAFNDMVGEIKSLKINVYEEKLSKQRINMQFLKLQIAPHFLINCLSIAYQLAELNKPDLSKMMLRDLSQHLRYTLSSGDVVSLDQEMIHVKNYIELSKIRYPNGIILYDECHPDTMDASIISVLIQTFVENTIKYEVELTKTINIHIRASLIKKNEGDFLSLNIWDSGNGFDNNTLRLLQNIDEYIKSKPSRHIGIRNVYQRAALYYGSESCRFSFSNRPQAGAQIDIEIPYIKHLAPLNQQN